jgi:hypothetical protein
VPNTFTPILIGHRRNGRPIYLAQGAEDNPPPDPVSEPPPADPPDDDPEGADALADPGKKALEAMKARVRDERELRKAAETRAAAAEAKVKPADDPGPTPEEIRAEARKTVQAEVLKERALDRVEILAAKAFADPGDARHFLASHVEDFLDGDKVDQDAIKEALADLLKQKAYLGVKDPRQFQGTGDNGPRGTGKPRDLDALITDATAKGDVRAVLRLQNQKLADRKPQ